MKKMSIPQVLTCLLKDLKDSNAIQLAVMRLIKNYCLPLIQSGCKSIALFANSHALRLSVAYTRLVTFRNLRKTFSTSLCYKLEALSYRLISVLRRTTTFTDLKKEFKQFKVLTSVCLICRTYIDLLRDAADAKMNRTNHHRNEHHASAANEN